MRSFAAHHRAPRRPRLAEVPVQARHQPQALARDAGQQVFEQTRTPLEKYQEQIDKLQALANAHAIDTDTFIRAITMAKDTLAKASQQAVVPPLSDLPQLNATSLRLRAEVPGFNASGQDDGKQDIADTADNTKDTADNTARMASLMDSRLNFDVADISV